MDKMLIQMLKGSLISVEIFVLTLVFAIPFALLVAKGKMSKNKVIRGIVNIYIMIMRGTPLILQLLFFYFAPYYLFGLSWNRFTAVIVAFVVNYAAYFAEIYRGGLQAIDKGQYEASSVLGYSKTYSFFHIIVPQVVKNIMPAMANEVITLVKDTALAQTIGVAELFRIAQTSSSRVFSTVPLVIAGLFYFIMNGVLSKLFDKIERNLAYYD